MSKNLSLDIKTAYQGGLMLVGLLAITLIIVNVVTALQLLGKQPGQLSAKIREQQLIQAIQLVNPKSP